MSQRQRTPEAKFLLDPLSELLKRPGKSLRSSLLQTLFEAAQITAPMTGLDSSLDSDVETLKTVTEHLHLGSLIIDDIQDQSLIRRGAPPLYLSIGTPLAINAGNFLYFAAIDLVNKLACPELNKLQILLTVIDVMKRAHTGQALDLGVKINTYCQSEVADICERSHQLKSGALMELSFVLGPLYFSQSSQAIADLATLGNDYGQILQGFDDLGNLNSEKPTPKHWEDILHQRPSYVWKFAAETFSPTDYEHFQKLADTFALNPNENAQDFFLFLQQKDFLLAARTQLLRIYSEWTGKVQRAFAQHPHAEKIMSQIQTISGKVTTAYGT